MIWILVDWHGAGFYAGRISERGAVVVPLYTQVPAIAADKAFNDGFDFWFSIPDQQALAQRAAEDGCVLQIGE